MLPLFFRKRASLKQEPKLISEGWEEIGEKAPAIAVANDETLVVEVIEPKEEVIVTEQSTPPELAPIEVPFNAALEGLNAVQSMTDTEVEEETVLVEETHLDLDWHSKLAELHTKAQKLEAEMERLEKMCKICPVCSGKAAIVIDVSRALDLMRDIFTTGIQYQQRVVNRVCDELCQFAEE